MDCLDAEGFFAYARERYRILLRRQGQLTSQGDWSEGIPKSGKWTNDKILQDYRFCNVFREDDVVTKWIRNNVTYERYGDQVLEAMIIARWFNRVETMEKLLPQPDASPPYFIKNMLYQWNSQVVRERLTGVSPLVTGAFIVKTPNGMSKLEGLIWCIEHVVGQRLVDTMPVSCESKSAELRKHVGTLKGMTEWLCQFPFLGPFMAYEVVTDLRHTPLLCNAPDIMTWANPGPGAKRGAARLEGYDLRYFTSTQRANEMQVLMQRLLGLSTIDRYWPNDWPQWEMREVEHSLCEWDKYERVRLGQGTPKQRYNGGI